MATAIKRDHFVKTADGHICCVQYVGKDYASVWHLDALGKPTGDTIDLPLSELRRVSNPRAKRPPVEGMPETRPQCAWCNKPLTAVLDSFDEQGKRFYFLTSKRIARRVFLHWRTVEQVFCTSKCAIRFGGASYRGGYRRNNKKP